MVRCNNPGLKVFQRRLGTANWAFGEDKGSWLNCQEKSCGHSAATGQEPGVGLSRVETALLSACPRSTCQEMESSDGFREVEKGEGRSHTKTRLRRCNTRCMRNGKPISKYIEKGVANE